MTAPKGTIWNAEPHTLAKHAVLQAYLEAWFPILGKRGERIIYYDGFAGPGRYSGGEEGSPLIALNVALRHQERLKNCEVFFIFVEQNRERAQWLDKQELPSVPLPDNFKVAVRNKPFEEALESTLDRLDDQRLGYAPTFAFVDPFGITGLRFDLIERLLRRAGCEVLVTFMTSAVNRFVTELPDQIGALLGDHHAPSVIHRAADGASEARRIYAASLRHAARFVRSFRMKDRRGAPVYDLFFATNHRLGHVRMKEAMWKVDATGGYSFSDGLDPAQTVLFRQDAAVDLAPWLWGQFRGRVVDSNEVIRYAEDETPFLAKHARDALSMLEEGRGLGTGRISVDPIKSDGKKRRAGTFAAGTTVRFLE